jgi:methionyl-tRNA formyltransferase
MGMNSIIVGPVDTLILFGGGELIISCAKFALTKGVKTYVIAAKRHLNEIVDHERGLSLKDVLAKEKTNHYQARNINAFLTRKKLVTKKTIGIGLGETYTFNKKTIKLFDNKLFDFMTIKLPQYRGGAHFTWQILREDKTGCWNIQIINEQMIPGVFDNGTIIKTRAYRLPNSVRIPKDYFRTANQEGLELFKEFLDEVQTGKSFTTKKIDERKSIYFPRLGTAIHGFINWSWKAKEINNFICAFDDPYMGASTFIGNQRVFLHQCKVTTDDGIFHPFMSGLIYRVTKNKIFVAASDKSLIIGKVIFERRNIVDELKVGQRFYTPIKYLEKAAQYNAEYNSEGLVKKK